MNIKSPCSMEISLDRLEYQAQKLYKKKKKEYPWMSIKEFMNPLKDLKERYEDLRKRLALIKISPAKRNHPVWGKIKKREKQLKEYLEKQDKLDDLVHKAYSLYSQSVEECKDRLFTDEIEQKFKKLKKEYELKYERLEKERTNLFGKYSYSPVHCLEKSTIWENFEKRLNPYLEGQLELDILTNRVCYLYSKATQQILSKEDKESLENIYLKSIQNRTFPIKAARSIEKLISEYREKHSDLKKRCKKLFGRYAVEPIHSLENDAIWAEVKEILVPFRLTSTLRGFHVVFSCDKSYQPEKEKTLSEIFNCISESETGQLL